MKGRMCFDNCPRRFLAQTAKARGGTLEVPAYRQDYFAAAEKNLDFREHRPQRIAQKYAKDWRQFTGGRINTPRSSKSGIDSDKEQTENDFKDPEDGFWDKNNSEGIVSNSEVPVNLDIRGECCYAL